MENKVGKYPIFDTDYWIKSCKLEQMFNKDIIKIYGKKMYVSDAVDFEIKSKAKDDSKLFMYSSKQLSKHCKEHNIYRMNLSDTDLFDHKIKKAVIRAFIIHNIPYNEIKGCYTKRQKNLGEKVSIIYAWIKDLPVVLSDDKGAKDFAKTYYKLVKIYNFKTVLEEYCKINHIQAQKYCEEINKDKKIKNINKNESDDNKLLRYKEMLMRKYNN